MRLGLVRRLIRGLQRWLAVVLLYLGEIGGHTHTHKLTEWVFIFFLTVKGKDSVLSVQVSHIICEFLL